MDDVALWALIAVGLFVTEVLTLSLVAAMLAVGALAALAAAAAGTGLPVQLLAFAGTSMLMLGVVRPVARRSLRALPILANSPDGALVGQAAVVVEQVSAGAGQVRVHGELWSARPAVEGDVLQPGTRVFVSSVSGATVRVHPSDLDYSPALPAEPT